MTNQEFAAHLAAHPDTVLVSRKHAAFLLTRWPDDVTRHRNYELEGELEDRYGGEWVIAEWCPFNGLFCAYHRHAPDEVLLKAWRWWQRNRYELTRRGYNVDAHLQYITEAPYWGRPAPQKDLATPS